MVLTMKKTTSMKNLALLVTGLLLLVFTACSDDNSTNDINTPGNIPGMGNTEGELEISQAFTLPEGVSLVSIQGVESPDPALEFTSSTLKTATTKDDDDDEIQDLYYLPAVGSGGEWIALELLFEIVYNADGTVNKDIFIPAGTLVECQEDGYQSGIVLQDVRIHIDEPKSDNASPLAYHLQIKLYTYCINKGKTGSSSVVTYVLKGLSSSEWIEELVDALAYKAIDISDFTAEQLEEYEYITAGLQDIVWAITNGQGVNEKDWEFIEALREEINE